MLYIIITSYGEPKATEKAVNAFLNQNIKQNFKIIVSDPFPETKWMLQESFPNNSKVEYFEDPDQGKSYALNILLKRLYSENRNDIFILTDGDVFVEKNSVQEILNKFQDEKVGCVSGRPISLNSKNNILGYWSHFLTDVAAHKISRKKRYEKGKFLECTGYLFAFRNGIIDKFPLDVAEDTIVPYLMWEKGYKIAYAENSLVYVKWPTNLKDWIKQKKRTADAHSKLTKYIKNFPKVKSFKSELVEGTFMNFTKVWSYPKNLKEYFYTALLFPLRFYIWLSLYKDLKQKKEYKDGWRENLEFKSTRPLD